jgi:membrane-associated HD superfamily phosphohydrolase
VELLKQYRVPKPIQDIATQHHETLIRYFYFKSLKQTDGAQVLEEDFRYPGPKAQFKEAAIVGICDCVEAAGSFYRPADACAY